MLQSTPVPELWPVLTPVVAPTAVDALCEDDEPEDAEPEDEDAPLPAPPVPSSTTAVPPQPETATTEITKKTAKRMA